MRALFAIALAATLAALAAGCSSPAGDDPSTLSDADAAAGDGAAGQPAQAAPTIDQLLYEHDEMVAGAGPPDPSGGEGPLPPAKLEEFEVPAGTLDLSFEAELCGSGVALIEVVGPDGATAWMSDTVRMAGADGVACVWVYEPGGPSGNPYPPGRYEARYWLAGAMRMGLTVTAEMPAPAGATPA